MKVFIAQLNPTIGKFNENSYKIIDQINRAKLEGAELVVFSELAICGYMPDDLLFDSRFILGCADTLAMIQPHTAGISAIVGTVRKEGNALYNSAAVFSDGELLGYQDKCLLPTYDIFDEARYFVPGKTERIWQFETKSGKKRVAITICEDIWASFDPGVKARYPKDPLDLLDNKSFDLLVNISASPYSFSKIETRKALVKSLAKRFSVPVCLVNQVGAQDQIIFDGSSLLIDKNGKVQFQANSFVECGKSIDLTGNCDQEKPFNPVEMLYQALRLGIVDYFHKQGFKKACLGISGGIDSAVVASIAVDALGKENVEGFLLPSRFTLKKSIDDAQKIAKNLGINLQTFSIEGAFEAYLTTLQSTTFGIAEENLQSRIRGTLLMALSNKHGYLLLNTGNKSELAVGYTTLYGDACGAIGVLGDLLKRQVYMLARYINKDSEIIPVRVLEREPSAELRKNQKDSDSLPDYAILDTIVDAFIVSGMSCDEIAKKYHFEYALVDEICRKIHQNEYKRRQLPFSLRVSEKAFSAGRKVPIVHSFL